MNREPGGENRSLVREIRIFLDRMKARLAGRSDKESQHQSSFDPKELLFLFASAGPEGQQPKTTFEEGSALVFEPKSRLLSPRTILREECLHAIDGTQYFFWCVGEYQPDGSVFIYDAFFDGMERGLPYLCTDPNFVVVPRLLTRNTETGIEFVVGGDGNIIDLWISSENDQGKPIPELVLDCRKQRKTVRIDIMQMGTPVRSKVEKPEPSRGSRQLIPSPVPTS